jgi:hypothetical protein
MSASAVLKAFAVSPVARVKKLEAKLSAHDGRLVALAVEEAAIDGGEDPAARVAAGAAVQTARAERLVLVGALEAARQIVAQAEAEEAARQAVVRREKLQAQVEAAGKDLEAALVGVCAPLGRFNALLDQLDDDRPRLGVEDYCLAASAIACKEIPKWPIRGNPKGDTRTVDFQLTVPVGK